MKGMDGKTGTYMHTAKERILDWPSKANKRHIQIQKKRDENRRKMLEENESLSFGSKKENTNRYNVQAGIRTDTKKQKGIAIKYRENMQVVHVDFGEGTVMAVYTNKIRVKFKNRDRGVKDFDIKTVNKGQLIMPLEMAEHKKSLRK